MPRARAFLEPARDSGTAPSPTLHASPRKINPLVSKVKDASHKPLVTRTRGYSPPTRESVSQRNDTTRIGPFRDCLGFRFHEGMYCSCC